MRYLFKRGQGAVEGRPYFTSSEFEKERVCFKYLVGTSSKKEKKKKEKKGTQ